MYLRAILALNYVATYVYLHIYVCSYSCVAANHWLIIYTININKACKVTNTATKSIVSMYV